MCLAIPGKVKEIAGRKLTIEYPREVRFALDGGVSVTVGDYVLIQMGVVIKKLTREEAVISTKAWFQQTAGLKSKKH